MDHRRLRAARYLATSGQLYWSDTHQLSVYIDDYHRWLDQQLGSAVPATEMISEIYAPRSALLGLLVDARRALSDARADVIYGTIRFIERDDESFLAWARERYACVIFNLHVVHTSAGLERAARAFRALIDAATAHGGRRSGRRSPGSCSSSSWMVVIFHPSCRDGLPPDTLG